MFTRYSLCLISVLAYSCNLFGYEIISSRTEVSPGFEGGILKQKTVALPLRNAGNVSGITASAGATVYASRGNKGDVVKLSSNHSVSILNNTENYQQINIKMKLFTHDGKSTSSENNIRMEPGESINQSTLLYFVKEYLNTGCYKVQAQTTISGSAYSFASDCNTVTITQ